MNAHVKTTTVITTEKVSFQTRKVKEAKKRYANDA